MTTFEEELQEIIEKNLWGLCCKNCGGGGMNGGETCVDCSGTGITDWKTEPLIEMVKKEILANYLPISHIKKVVEEMKRKGEPKYTESYIYQETYNQALSDLLKRLEIE